MNEWKQNNRESDFSYRRNDGAASCPKLNEMIIGYSEQPT